MSLDFLLENMCKTCVYLYSKNRNFFQNICKNYMNFLTRACINVYVIFSLNTYVEQSKDYMLSLQLQ
jgi:type III secretory pathway component EscU